MIISIGFSGGKDSTVLFHLINEEAKKRDKFILYFQDQAEYQEWAMESM
jgi:predicted phosphoadenosine phosphosulfate sulfurtransferase